MAALDARVFRHVNGDMPLVGRPVRRKGFDRRNHDHVRCVADSYDIGSSGNGTHSSSVPRANRLLLRRHTSKNCSRRGHIGIVDSWQLERNRGCRSTFRGQKIHTTIRLPIIASSLLAIVRPDNLYATFVLWGHRAIQGHTVAIISIFLIPVVMAFLIHSQSMKGRS